MPIPRVVWLKRSAIVAGVGFLFYAIDHWPRAEAALDWGLLGLVASMSWVASDAALGQTKTPWRTTATAAIGCLGIAALLAVNATENVSCGRTGECYWNQRLFVQTMALRGIPLLINVFRYRNRFPGPDRGAPVL